MYNKHLFISGIIMVSAIFSTSQPLNAPLGARAVAMGNCGLVNKDVWATYNNQAGLAFLEGIEFGISLENRYMLKEMNRISLATAAQLGTGGLFAGIDHLGDQFYSEMMAGAGYALQIGKRFAAGLKLDYLRMAIGDGYGSYHAFTFEGGILASVSDKLSVGVHCFNPIHAGWTGTNEHIPITIRGGFGFMPDASISIVGEVLKSTADPAVISAGCEYRYRDRFFIRAGLTSGPARLSFGTGIRLKKMAIDIASGLHSFLGLSTQISFTYSTKQ